MDELWGRVTKKANVCSTTVLPLSLLYYTSPQDSPKSSATRTGPRHQPCPLRQTLVSAFIYLHRSIYLSTRWGASQGQRRPSDPREDGSCD